MEHLLEETDNGVVVYETDNHTGEAVYRGECFEEAPWADSYERLGYEDVREAYLSEDLDLRTAETIGRVAGNSSFLSLDLLMYDLGLAKESTKIGGDIAEGVSPDLRPVGMSLGLTAYLAGAYSSALVSGKLLKEFERSEGDD